MRMKPIFITRHAMSRAELRGTSAEEIKNAVEYGKPEPAKSGRVMYRLEVPYERQWNGKWYSNKQVAPVTVDEVN